MNILNKKTNILIVTGGVFSSLGKGVASSSVGAMLQCFGYKVMIMKFDPYLNVDAGTMSPEQHGEVFVTFDGNETDLDIGNYERFLNINLPKESNITAGKIYHETLKKERDGDFLGSTIQVIPHITTAINNKIIDISNKYEPNFLIVEVGGTIGDIESIPFLEALRQLYAKNKNQVMFIHTVPLIELLTSQEGKTKPLQHSVKELMSFGIFPNLLFLRSKSEISPRTKQKISLTTGIDEKKIISLMNLKHVYLLPEVLKLQNLHKIIFDYFKLDVNKEQVSYEWDKFINLIKQPKSYKAKIAVVGKYVETDDAYLSVITSLKIAALYTNTEIEIDLINSSKVNDTNVNNLRIYDGILIPGGFGNRGIDGKLCAIKFARENNIPLLGICLGLQLSCIEFARNVLGLKDANSTEFDPNTPHPIITILEGKDSDKNMGGTLRLGNYPCQLLPNSKAYYAYNKKDVIFERHRHRYEVNYFKYKDDFEKHGLVFSGIYKEKELVEIIELKNHKFFVASQFHPEFTTKTFSPNPLFKSFIDVAKK